MTDGPEAKAAYEILNHQIKDQCYRTETATEILIRANATHYLPLLRELHRQVIDMKEAGYHGADLYDAIGNVEAEIARLEKGSA